jgi:acetate kinase
VNEHVLVLNAGSSSLKYSLTDVSTGVAVATGLAERIGEAAGSVRHRGPGGEDRSEEPIPTHEAALRAVLRAFDRSGPPLSTVDVVAVGHRVVHGGADFADPVLIDDPVVDAVTRLIPLAPLHNPANLEGIAVARRLFPDLPQVAVFDTAFHQTLPERAYCYAVPDAWRRQHRVRRYGFHGTSHAFVSAAAAELLGRPPEAVNVIVLHLGNGCSATAVAAGRSIDTSMGLTPLEGLVMGTRSGDIDPALQAHLHREHGWTLEEIDGALNRESGLKGLCGTNDFREVTRLVDAGDESARLAFDVYCYRIRKYVGAYYAALGTVDAIAFTAGVGENSPQVRAGAVGGLEALGIRLDERANAADARGARVVSAADSRVAVMVIPTNEEWEIARQALAVLRR